MKKKQWLVLLVFLGVYGLLVWAYFVMMAPQMVAQLPVTKFSPVGLGLVIGVGVMVFYGLLSLAGMFFYGRLDLPRVFREGAGWKAWFWQPLGIGAALGVLLVLFDRIFAALGGSQGFPHPQFPLSIIASATAGIGEEIIFRGFVMGLWAWLFWLLLRRWKDKGKQAALWIGNGIGALAFSAGHLPAVMVLYNVTSPEQLPWLVLVEMVALNSLIGLVAGERAIKDGIVAAIGIHFWADIVWHVLWPLLALGLGWVK